MEHHHDSRFGKPLYALPAHIEPLDAARGTILALDWRALRTLGFYAEYEAAIEPEQRPALLASTPGSWVQLELLFAHYRALDSMALQEDAIRLVGRTVGEGVHGSFLSTLIRLAGQLGVSPWLALEQCYKLWVRSWRGGAISVHRTGERLAHVELMATPVCFSRFFCISFASALCAGIAPFGSNPEAHELATTRTHSSVTFRVSWDALQL